MELLKEIDNYIEVNRNLLVSDIIEFINMKSIKQPATKGCPFGEDIKAFLEYFKARCQEEGFYIKDYGTGIVSASLYDTEIDLGIWLHGDTVSVGDGWNFNPFNAVEYEACIIGRGATDNKGQLSAVFNLFKILKKLNVKLEYNPAIFLGSDEESGMSDLRAFLENNQPPALSLVPDGDFPVAYGGKGSIKIKLHSKASLKDFVLEAGQIENPAKASAYFSSFDFTRKLKYATAVKKNNCVEVSVNTLPVHGSKPNKNGNMITLLTEELSDFEGVCESDKRIINFLNVLSKDIYGEIFGLKKTTASAPLTVNLNQINNANRIVELCLDIRYPVEYTEIEIEKKISQTCKECGFILAEIQNNTKPFIISKKDKTLNLLCMIANSVCEDSQPPYLVAGSTYAHLLPNAYIFGMSGNLPPTSFSVGRGGAHGVDEAVSIKRLQRAMKIYTRVLISLRKDMLKTPQI